MLEPSQDTTDPDSRGVSPVIGVILMVAITVILAAVIASFVLGFGGNVQENVNAGADITETEDGNATVSWISEGNADYLNVTHDDDSGDVKFAGGTHNITSVGETVELHYDGSGSETITVTVTAVGSSGTKAVVTQEEVTVEN
ncbi:type IV pilin [Halobacterium yunchengense]|uniref:type IV pilin n=1 Tax=Halobacterium yunchengense TaxID=3108497 RepID=UPI00300B1658